LEVKAVRLHVISKKDQIFSKGKYDVSDIEGQVLND